MTTHYDKSPKDVDTPITRTLRRLSLAWPILIVCLGVLVKLVQMSGQQDHMQKTLERMDSKVSEHIGSDGHRVALERTKAVMERVERLEKKSGP
jgi:hypothetical protein